MAYWIIVSVNSDDKYAVEMKNVDGTFEVVSDWFDTQDEAVNLANSIVATKTALEAKQASKQAGDTLDRETSISIAE